MLSSADSQLGAGRSFDKPTVLAALSSRPFCAPWWLRNRHAQTIWSRFLRPTTAPPMRLERWRTPDGDRVRVHLRENDASAPWLLLLHGLEGCVTSNYMLGMRRQADARGWNTAALEFRSCGGELNSARRMYHSGETRDAGFFLSGVESRLKPSAIYVAGFSLGGNVMAKWLGEEGAAVSDVVRAVAVISAPFDLTVSGPQIDRALGGIYVRRFLKTLIPKAIAKAEQHPGCLDPERVRSCRTFREFDTHATAALHGFEDAEDYWRRSGCGSFLGGVRVPTLLLSSADDPFNPSSTLPLAECEDSPWLVPQFSERGGHVGFVSGVPWRTSHWAEEQAMRFFELVGEPGRSSRS